MKWFYLRWGGIVLAGIVITVMAAQRYESSVKSITPQELLASPSTGTVRVIGMVLPGSLTLDPPTADQPQMEATFELAGPQEQIPVHYSGPEDDNLRELKTIVIVGQLDDATGTVESGRIDLIPNFGFITAAYLLTLIPLALFLFLMEQRVALLYTVIKGATVYKPEEQRVEQR